MKKQLLFVMTLAIVVFHSTINAQVEAWKNYGIYEKKGKYGFIEKYNDPNSRKLTEPIFESVENFQRCPFTRVGKECTKLKNGSLQCNKFAIINDKFELVTDYEFQAVAFSYQSAFDKKEWKLDPQCDKLENVAMVLKGGKAGLFDLVNKKYILPPIATNFKTQKETYSNRVYSQGRLIIYQIENGKWGILDIEGNEICKPELDDVDPVINSNDKDKTCINTAHAIITKDGKKGVAHYKNGITIPPIYDQIIAYNIDGEYMKVKKDGKWGVGFSEKGITVPPIYDEIWNFWSYGLVTEKKTPIEKGMSNFVMAKKDDKEALFYVKTGTEISSDIYSNAIQIVGFGEYIITSNGNKIGVYSTATSRMTVPFRYDEIQMGWKTDTCTAFMVKEGNSYFIIDDNNNLISNRGFEQIFKPNPKLKYYQTTTGLCNAACDSIFYLNNNCKLTASAIISVDPSKQPYVKSELEKSIEKIGEDIDNRLKQLKQVKCSCCNGSGKSKIPEKTYKTCPQCKGVGRFMFLNREVLCTMCDRNHVVVDKEWYPDCKCCGGSGIYKN